MEVGTGICLDPAPSLFPEQLPGGSAGSWGRRGARAGDVELWDVEPPSGTFGDQTELPKLCCTRDTPTLSTTAEKSRIGNIPWDFPGCVQQGGDDLGDIKP